MINYYTFAWEAFYLVRDKFALHKCLANIFVPMINVQHARVSLFLTEDHSTNSPETSIF